MSLGVLVNCSKVPDNHAVYRQLEVVRHTVSYMDATTHSPTIVLPAIMIVAYMHTSSDMKLLQIPDNSLELMVDTLCETMEAKHRHHGCNAYELTESLAYLAIHPTNRKGVVDKGGVAAFLRLIQEGEDVEKEVAVNAVYEYTDDNTRCQIAATPGLMDSLMQLKEGSQEDLSQSASRALHKLDIMHIMGESHTCQPRWPQVRHMSHRSTMSATVPQRHMLHRCVTNGCGMQHHATPLCD